MVVNLSIMRIIALQSKVICYSASTNSTSTKSTVNYNVNKFLCGLQVPVFPGQSEALVGYCYKNRKILKMRIICKL